jgi:hypothetical protein
MRRLQVKKQRELERLQTGRLVLQYYGGETKRTEKVTDRSSLDDLYVTLFDSLCFAMLK